MLRELLLELSEALRFLKKALLNKLDYKSFEKKKSELTLIRKLQLTFDSSSLKFVFLSNGLLG